MISDDLDDKIQSIKNKLNFIEDIRKSLRDRVESNIGSLFESNMALQERMYQRTTELDNANKHLQEEISEREKIENALRQSENRYKRLVGATTDYIYTVEIKNGKPVKTSHGPGCIAVTGYTRQEYNDSPLLWIRMVHEEDRHAVTNLAERVLKGEAVSPLEHRIVHKYGSIRWVRNTPVPRFDEQGRLAACDGLISDITERKFAEDAMRQSENRYKRLVGAITDYIYTVEIRDGKPVRTSHGPGCVAVTGYTSEEYNADPFLWYQMTHRDDRGMVVSIGEKILEGKKPVSSVEHRIIHKDGSTRWVKNTPVPRFDEHGALTAYDGLISDITERKMTEEELRKSKEQLQDFFDNAHDMIQIINSAGRFIYVNRAWRETLGYSEEEVFLSLTFMDVVHRDHHQQCMSIFDRCLTGNSSRRVETVFTAKGGRMIDVLGSLNCSKDGAGGIEIRGIFRDITERKRAEVALKKYSDELEVRVKERSAEVLQAKNHLESVLSSMTDALIVTNPEHVIRTVNQSACKLLGYDEAALVNKAGKPVTEVFREDIRREIARAQKKGFSKDAFMTLKTAGGESIPVLVNLSRLGLKGSDTTIVVHDMREIKKLEEESQRIQLKMLAASKMATLGEISTGIAHEINQPLTFISSFIQGILIDSKHGELPLEEILKDAQVAYRQVQRIVNIIQHLRTFGRRDDIVMRPVRLDEVLSNTLLLLGERIRLSSIDLAAEVEKTPCTVMGNANQLEQVFINLLQNSIDAICEKNDRMTEAAPALCPPNGKKGFINVNIRHCEGGRFVQVSFSDNASGIQKEHLDKIFEPFFTTKEVGRGTGLGLSIAYGIIREHNGAISCESSPGEGSTFTITIPAHKENDKERQ
jgi:PAS domain S-box-containing protein